MDKSVETDFRRIPGVGRSIAQDLWNLGLRGVDDLKTCEAQELYERLCGLEKTKIDRCMLYVLRLAVYFARTAPEEREPELLKWWNWKDCKMPANHLDK